MIDNYTSPDYNKSALIIIDVQNDFSLPGAISEIHGTFDIISNIKKLVDFFRIKKHPIIHVIRIYRTDGSNVDLCRRKLIENGKRIVSPDTEGVQIVECLLPDKSIKIDSNLLLTKGIQKIGDFEYIIFKSRWGAFYKTVLEDHLTKLDIKTPVFCGCNFPNCPRASIYEASERDYKIVFIKDATSQIYDKGIDELINIGVKVLTTDELIKKM